MNRILFFVMTLAFAPNVWAQTAEPTVRPKLGPGSPRPMRVDEVLQQQVYKLPEPIPGNVPNVTIARSGNLSVIARGVPAYQIVRVVTDMMGYEVVWHMGNMPRDALSVSIADHDANTILTMILSAVGYRFDKDNIAKTITVYRQGEIWQQKTEPRSTAGGGLFGPEMSPAEVDAYNAANYPRPEYRRGGSLFGPEMTPAEVDAYNATHYPRPLYRRGLGYPEGYYGNYSGPYFPFYDHYYGYLYWKGCMTGPSGKIKFKYMGKHDERHLWYVALNGEVVGTIDQGDSFWNHVDVCAGSTRVTITKLGIGKWEERYSIRPGVLTEISVGDFLPLR